MWEHACEIQYRTLVMNYASSWLFDFVSYFLARYKNENNSLYYVSVWNFFFFF